MPIKPNEKEISKTSLEYQQLDDLNVESLRKELQDISTSIIKHIFKILIEKIHFLVKKKVTPKSLYKI